MSDLNQSQYSIEVASLTADRWAEGAELDLRQIIAEINIYENIELPYITASIVLIDDASIQNVAGIFGTERLHLRIIHPSTLSSAAIDKKFMVTGVQKSVRTNERTEVLVLTLIEEHGYFNNVIRVSKSYNGIPSNIIQTIIPEYFNDINVEIFNDGSTGELLEAQSNMKVIIPRYTPLQACDWIRDRMTTRLGAPFFFYSAINNQALILQNLEQIAATTAWNKDKYIYADSVRYGEDVINNFDNIFSIEQLDITTVNSGLISITAGAVGADLSVSNLENGSTFQVQHDGLNSFIEMLGMDPETSKDDMIFDKDLLYQDQPIEELPSRYFHQYHDTGIYGGDLSYYDEELEENHITKIQSASARSLLLRNNMTIKIPGLPFLLGNTAAVGTNINIDVLASAHNQYTTNDEKFDMKRSGKFMLYNTRHIFRDKTYDVVAKVVKVGRNERQ